MYSFTLTDYKWNWIDEGLLPYALAAMRATWVGLLVRLWSRGLMSYRPDLITPFLAFGLLAASIACTQFGVYVVKSTPQSVALIVLSGLIAIALTLYLGLAADRPALWELRWVALLAQNPAATIMTVLVAVWLWWWGVRTGRGRVYCDLFTADFTWGMVMLAVGVAVAYATRVIPLLQVLLALILFFAVGLAATAVANLQSARRFEGGRTGQSLGVNRYWLGTVVVVIGVVLVAGLLLSQLFTPGAITWILARLATLLEWLAWLLLLVFALVSYPLFAFFEWIARLVRPGSGPNDRPLSNPPNFAEQFKNLQPGHPNVSPQVYVSLQVLAGILLVSVIVLIFALAFRRFKTLLEEDVEETREIILSMDLLKEQLAQLFRRKSRADSVEPVPFVSIVGDDPRARIRRAYQSLLAWAALQGIPRSPGQTPGEYLSALSDALPAYSEPLSILTAAYLQARYSAVPISSASAEQALRVWEAIVQQDGKHGLHQ